MTKKGQYLELPSRHAIGDTVTVNLYMGGTLRWCTITSIKFTEDGKVLYDVRVPLTAETGFTKLYDIDSLYLESIEQEAGNIARTESTNL